MMRVVHATYPWAFETPGGGEIQMLKYGQYLRESGLEIVHHDPWSADLGKADVVHFFSCMGGSVHFCRHVKSRGIPLVVSASLWLTAETKHLYPVDEIAQQLSLADAIVTNGDIESDQLSAVLGIARGRFHTVRNACDPWFAEPVDPDIFRTAFGVDGPFVLHVGNIEPRKNQLALIHAAKQAGKSLVLLGHVRNRVYAGKCLAAAGNHVRYLGPVAHDDALLRSAYAACEVFCLPSTLETPGLAALEAAATGARLVVTGEGSTREYFGEDGLYVDGGNVGEIAAALIKSSNAPPPENLKRRVVSQFTWDKAVEPLRDLYNMLATAR